MGFEVTRDGKATCQELDGTKDLHHVNPLALAVLRFRSFDSVLRLAQNRGFRLRYTSADRRSGLRSG